jgi:hypothetical protein
MNRRAFFLAPLALLIPSHPTEGVKIIQTMHFDSAVPVSLVPVAEVKREATEVMHKLRNELLALPGRMGWVDPQNEVAGWEEAIKASQIRRLG